MTATVELGTDAVTQLPVGISAEDRRRSTYVIGKPGSGKSTLLENIAVQDMRNGDGLCMLDPHGDSANLLLAAVPHNRKADIIYWHPRDIAHPFGLNPFFCTNRDDALEVDQRVEHFLSALSSLEEFAEVFAAAPRMSDILRHLAFAFVLNEGMTLLETPRFLTNTTFRAQFYPAIERYGRDDIVEYWQAFDAIRLETRREELVASSLNKLRRLTTTTILRLIFGQATPSIDFRTAMDTGKIVIVNLQGLGEGNADVIGAFVVWEVLAGAFARGDADLQKRRLFHLILDEFQKFSSTAVPQLIEECRKYGVDSIIAHQHRRQLEGKTLGATLTAPNRVVFQVTGEDAAILAREFTIVAPPAEQVPQILTEPVMETYFDPAYTTPEIVQVEEEFARNERELRALRELSAQLIAQRYVLDYCFVVPTCPEETVAGLDVLENDHHGARYYYMQSIKEALFKGTLTPEQVKNPALLPDTYWIYDRKHRYAPIYRSLNPNHRQPEVAAYARACLERDRISMKLGRWRGSFPIDIPTIAEQRFDELVSGKALVKGGVASAEGRAIAAQLRDEFLSIFLPLKATTQYTWDERHTEDCKEWHRRYRREKITASGVYLDLDQWAGGPLGGGNWELTEFPAVLDWLTTHVNSIKTQRFVCEVQQIRGLEKRQEAIKQQLRELRTRQRYLGYDRQVKDNPGTRDEQARYISRPGSQRAIDDIANELANTLATLPPFVACCKVGRQEATIQTFNPVAVTEADKAAAQELKARSAATYGRERAIVEADMARRRQGSATDGDSATIDAHADNPPADRPNPNLSNVFESDDI